MLKGLLATSAACALAGGVAVAGHAAQAPSASAAPAAAPASTVALSAATTGGTGLATTAASTAATTARPTGKQRCELLPGRVARTEKLEKTLAGGPTTAGSIAYLKARIAKAEAAHDDTLVARLTARLQFRTALQGFLPQRLDLLRTASTTICAVK